MDGDIQSQYEELAELVDSRQFSDARRETGELGEATAAGLIELVRDGHLTEQHTPVDAPQGIDLAYYDDHDEKVHVSEVKTIGWGDYHAPRMNETLAGRQASQDWIADRADSLDLAPDDVGPEADQVGAEVIQIDIPGGSIGVFDVSADGTIASEPIEMYSLDDVTEALDSWSDEADNDNADDELGAGERE